MMPAAQAWPPAWGVMVFAGCYVGFGSLFVVLMRIAAETEGAGVHGAETFHKPVFLTFVVFMGMSVALPLDADTRGRCCARTQRVRGYNSLADDSTSSSSHA